jgi:predicted acylesterase/phospholipase RssA
MVQGERFDQLKPLDDLEVSLVRQALERPGLVSAEHEAWLRQAIAVARLHRIEGDGGTLLVEDQSERLRDEVLTVLGPQLGPGRTATGESLAAAAPLLVGRARRTAAEVRQRLSGRVEPEALDREIQQKALVLVAGGGGGTGYSHLGAFTLLQELGIRPQLLVGTSMGSILGLFRARKVDFDPGEMVSVLRSISYRKVFRLISMDSRYGMPAMLRLYLRAAIGRHFPTASGAPLRLKDLAVPLIVTVSGVRRSELPHPPEYYEQLLSLGDLRLILSPNKLRKKVIEIVTALGELAQLPSLQAIHLGADPETLEFDALDAVGFSSSLPGVIHYDVVRDDPRMHQLLAGMLEKHDLYRLFDGGLTSNVSAKAAWQAVHHGRIGTRNALILALDCFSPRLSTPLWLPLQRIAARNTEPNVPWAHLYHRFASTLSPLELVPSVDAMLGISQAAREELLYLAPLLRRLMAPLPPLAAPAVVSAA